MQEAELKAAAVGILTYLAILNEETTRHSGEYGEIMEFDAPYNPAASNWRCVILRG